jgi:hypothetical protein
VISLPSIFVDVILLLAVVFISEWIYRFKINNNMNAKEKANELVEKYLKTVIYFPYVDTKDGSCIGTGHMTYISAVKCAINIVDEILDNNCGSHTDESNATNSEIYCDEYFWMDVMSELKDLIINR